jgi:hypothetical protein
MNRCTRRWILAFALLGPTLTSTVATAENAPVLPPGAHPHGRTYSEWAAAWWRWLLSQPASTNPILDPTGAFCANGQEGKVWFLAGTFGGTATRSCTVPPGTALLFPAVNLVSCGVPPDRATEEEVRSAVSIVPEEASGLNATIDGIPVSDIQGRYFEQSALFEVGLPADNLFGLPAGTVVAPCVDAGYYLMVHPLPPGEHTIEFGGSLTDFSTQVTYHITVSR